MRRGEDTLTGARVQTGVAARTVIGTYRIVRNLGAGQMGEVYEARSPDGTIVALKVLQPVRDALGARAPDRDMLARFYREARLCARLSSPHIVPTLDFGVHEGSPFFVMRRLRGADLDTWLERIGPLRPPVAVALALQIAEAMRVAHAAGVIHRDLKPANVFLDEDDGGGITAVVCDFGVAKMLDEDGALTASGALLGTPIYMAPEQVLDSKHVDARCDVWALAMCLYHALAGHAALAHLPTMADFVVALNKGEIPPLDAAAPWIDAELARAVHAALAPREARVASMDALAALLRPFGAGRALTKEDLAPLPDAERAPRGESPPSAPGGANDPLLGRVVAGRYALSKRLGVGGMGAVYEARDAQGGARVAVKLMLLAGAGSAEEGARRFVREARAALAVRSPHVVRLLDAGVDEETRASYIAMELLDGADLAAHIASRGALEPSPVVSLAVQACEGLAAAHALGVIHRDVKPSNLFLHEEHGRVVLKVCDFGIAKILQGAGGEASTELTHTGGLLGSPLYMSPEQAKSAKSVDARTDVWSLALSLHEALSGRRPWEGRTTMGEIIVAVCTEDAPPLHELAPWVPRAVSDAIARALQRDPARRFASIRELADALRPFALTREVTPRDLAPAMRAGDTVRVGGAPSAGGARVITADAVSLSTAQRAARRSPRAARAVAAGALFVALGAGALAWRARAHANDAAGAADGASALRPAWSAPDSPRAPRDEPPPAPTPLVALAPSAPGAPAVQAPLDAGAPRARAPERPRARPPRGDATGAPATRAAREPAPPSTSPPSATVGRGVTATDLPSP